MGIDVRSSNISSLTTIINSHTVTNAMSEHYGPYYNGVSKVVQVPTQDARTKALIHRLASEMKRLYTKYPKLAQ